jgi:hypothetical protein
MNFYFGVLHPVARTLSRLLWKNLLSQQLQTGRSVLFLAYLSSQSQVNVLLLSLLIEL